MSLELLIWLRKYARASSPINALSHNVKESRS